MLITAFGHSADCWCSCIYFERVCTIGMQPTTFAQSLQHWRIYVSLVHWRSLRQTRRTLKCASKEGAYVSKICWSRCSSPKRYSFLFQYQVQPVWHPQYRHIGHVFNGALAVKNYKQQELRATRYSSWFNFCFMY